MTPIEIKLEIKNLKEQSLALHKSAKFDTSRKVLEIRGKMLVLALEKAQQRLPLDIG